MALTNYSDLKTAIGNWLNRSDLTNYIPDFIKLAENRIYRELRIRAMESSFVKTIYGSQNLLTYSEGFNSWTNLNTTDTASSTLSPGGNNTYILTESSDTGVHRLLHPSQTEISPNETYTFSIRAKRESGTRDFWVNLYCSNNDYIACRFTFDTPTAIKSNYGGGSATSASMTLINESFYLCTLTGVISDISKHVKPLIGIMQTDGTESYAGDGSSGIYIWGAQLEKSSSAGTYRKTTDTILTATGAADLPSDYIELKSAYIDGTPAQVLQRKYPEFIYEEYPTRSSASKPKFIAREGNSFIFGPYPDSEYTVKGIYYKRFPELSTTNTTNWFTDNAMDLLLFGSLVEAEPFLKNDPRVQLWESKFNAARQAVMAEDLVESFSGSSLSMTYSQK